MSQREGLIEEIHRELDALDGNPWNAQWVTHAVLSRHVDGLAENDDANVWRYLGYAQCREEVRRCINKRAGEHIEEDEVQLMFPGYAHLQRHYIVTRNGEEVGIAVDQLTDDELSAKAKLHRSMGKSHYAHARDIDKFRTRRVAPPMFAEIDERSPRKVDKTA